MRYLCLIYDDEKAWESFSQAEQEKGMATYYAFDDSSRKSPPSGGRGTPAHQHGDDCPHAQWQDLHDRRSIRRGLKSSSAASISLEAKDLNDAIQVAARIPSAQWGGANEVRPIQEFPPQ